MPAPLGLGLSQLASSYALLSYIAGTTCSAVSLGRCLITTAATLRQQIDDALDSLSLDDRRNVLTLVQSLASAGRPLGISGPELVEFFKPFPKDAADEAYRFIREAHDKESACLDATPSR